MFTIRSEYMITVPFIVGMVLGNVNVIFKSRLLQSVNFVFMLTPLISILIFHRDIMHLSLFFFLTAMCTISYFLVSSNRQTIERESEVKANFVKEVCKLSSNLSSHDLRNELTKMMILSSKKYRENLPLFLETFDGFVQNVLAHVSFNVFESNPINIDDIVANLNHITNSSHVKFVYETEDNAKVIGHYNIIASLLKNFIENSIDAAMRRGHIAEVSMLKYENVIEIIDNCGGFDVDRIAMGNSSKLSKNHGIFLSTITDPSVQKMFGFKVTILRIVEGTRIIVMFDEMQLI